MDHKERCALSPYAAMIADLNRATLLIARTQIVADAAALEHKEKTSIPTHVDDAAPEAVPTALAEEDVYHGVRARFHVFLAEGCAMLLEESTRIIALLAILDSSDVLPLPAVGLLTPQERENMGFIVRPSSDTDGFPSGVDFLRTAPRSGHDG